MESKKGKVVLITGANKGIGKEIARQLGLLGYTVVVTARDQKAGARAVEELVAAGCDAHTVLDNPAILTPPPVILTPLSGIRFKELERLTILPFFS